MSIDLSTKAGALAFAKRERERMTGVFDDKGRFERNGFSQDAYVFATHDFSFDEKGPRTGPRLSAVQAIRTSVPIAAHALDFDRQRDGYAYILRRFAALTRAIGTLFMSEIWCSEIVLPKGADREEFERERAARPRSLEDWDARQEALYMALEHTATGRLFWKALIARNPTRLGAWQEQKFDDAEGRFVGLVEVRS